MKMQIFHFLLSVYIFDVTMGMELNIFKKELTGLRVWLVIGKVNFTNHFKVSYFYVCF